MKKVIVLAFVIFFAEMCTGIPVGYFEAELTGSLGLPGSEALSEVVGFAAVFLVCFLFARMWAEHAVVRSVLALSVVAVVSVFLSLGSGAGLPPFLLAVVGVVSGLIAAAAGAAVGRSGSRR